VAVSAPTLWEEGRLAGSRVTRLAIWGCVPVVALDLAINDRLTLLFDLGFVVLCVGAALAVRPRDFFQVGVLPPLLLLGIITMVALIHTPWIANPGDALVQAVVSGLAHRAGGLLTAYLLALAVLAMRQRVGRKRTQQAVAYAKRAGSPAPTRSTTAGPSERSTTVVGSEPHSPASSTASNQ
jgi:hypothetical protein